MAKSLAFKVVKLESSASPLVIPIFAVIVPETGTAVALNCVSVNGPVTAVVGIEAMETGCVDCQKVPVTGVVGIVAILTG